MLGKVKIAQVLAQAGLHLGQTAVGRKPASVETGRRNIKTGPG